MNAPVLENHSWNWRGWLAVFLLIFAAQFFLIYFLSARTVAPTKPQSSSVTFQIFPKPLAESQLAEKFLASDPTLFALPNTDGFSGAAWLNIPAREYNLSEQTEPPFWLPLNSQQLGNAVNRFVRTNFSVAMKSSESQRPTIFIPQAVDFTEGAKSASQLRMEGDLATRQLLNPPELKSQPGTDLLTNSVVQIAANKTGLVISARLISRSGSGEADHDALQIARQLQFEPGSDELSFGNAIFDWHTIPVAGTNSPAKVGAIQ